MNDIEDTGVNFGSDEVLPRRLTLTQAQNLMKLMPPIQVMKEILKKPSEERKPDDLQRLNALLKEIEFFKERDIKEHDLPQISACLKLEQFSPGDLVFDYNSLGDKFYIIIEGRVGVLIPRLGSDMEPISATQSPLHLNKSDQSRNETSQLQKSPRSMFTKKGFLESLEMKRNGSVSPTPKQKEHLQGFLEKVKDLTQSQTVSVNEENKEGSVIILHESQIKSKFKGAGDVNSLEQSEAQSRNKGQTPEDKRFSKNETQSSLQKSTKAVSQISANYIKKYFPEYNEVAVLQKGQSFGQLALLKNKPRAAGIVC